MEGVVLDATVVHFYAWLRGGTMPSLDRALWLAVLGARVGGWVSLDRRSRASFNRAFYREYRGLPADDLRERAPLRPQRLHPAARAPRRRAPHPRRTARAATAWCSSPARSTSSWSRSRTSPTSWWPRASWSAAGAFTGELAEPPLSADGRASLAARLAAEHGVDLADCHAYGDSVSDLPLLELVGHPVAVNPDFRLAREARRRGWSTLDWSVEPGARSRPPAPTEVAV